MSLITINRDLNSTGKKFFIENYIDVKEFWENKISKDELISRIKTKEDWQNKTDNSIQNKISSIKSFFDKEWNIDALKNTISSRLQIELVNKANDLFQLETGRPYDETIDKIEVSDDEEESIQNTKIKKAMSIPLNQIFYGPPGTGKTYNISSEAEKILNKNSSSDSREEKFKRIVQHINQNYPDKSYNETNGNNIYRNLSSAVKAWAWFLDPQYSDNNKLICADFKDIKGFKGSGWSQRLRTISDFGFSTAEKYENGKDVELNSFGVEFKNSIKKYLSEPNDERIDNLDQLKEYNYRTLKHIPSIFTEIYAAQLFKIQPNQGITAYTKTLLSGLLMALFDDYTQLNQDEDTTEDEKESISKYFKVNNYDTKDWKWNVWVADNLKDIGLLDYDLPDNKYKLTESGINLVDKLIENWSGEEIFSVELSYEVGVKLGRVKFITFHQSYSYEEFIEGIRPNLNGKDLTYSLDPGVFKQIADDAKGNQDDNYVIIIDEINRGNISKIFGELITLIEPSKRLFSDNPKEHPKQVTLPYSKKLFGVPKNLYILGTMNTADKSIALLDSALRRRFSFTEMLPKSSVLTNEKVKVEGIEIEKLFDTINQRIEFLIDKDHTIGHSYFLKIKDDQTIEALALLFRREIIPLLMEYFYGDFEKIHLVLGENKDWKSGRKEKFFKKKQAQQKNLFGKEEAVEGYDEKEVFEMDELLDLKEDGSIKSKPEDLVKLFESVYTPKPN
jgi:hypothetical protein